MAIKSFAFCDSFYEWSLEEVAFSDFNLLVGISGVGKTRILEALETIQKAGLRSARDANGCKWTLRLTVGEDIYAWSAETLKVSKDPTIMPADADRESGDRSDDSPEFIFEEIAQFGGDALVRRSTDEFVFQGSPLPKLKRTESAITLLRDEETIKPIRRALRQFMFSEPADLLSGSLLGAGTSVLNSARARYQTLASLREATDLPTFIRAYILQKDHPDAFQEVAAQFCEIFPTVEEVRVDYLSELDPAGVMATAAPLARFSILGVGIKERGVARLVCTPRLSSGMVRTLVHLFELHLAPSGTVVAIDEFENSMGVNCLPDIIDRLLERGRDLQFIVTSHHPYIINNVPTEWWKIVTRRGGVVSVKDAKTIPALTTGSKHDRFVQLLNLQEYEEGIAC